MIMHNRKVFYDESFWERVEARLKNWIYILMHELLQSQICSPFLYKILILIETIQFLYYSIHPNLSFLFTTVFYTYFQQLIQYFQVNSVLNGGDNTVFLVLLYFVFAIQLVMVVLVIAITYKILKSKKKSSTFLTYSLKIFSLYALLLNTVLAVPFFNVIILAVYCNKDSAAHKETECYSGLYFAHMAAAIIAGFILLIFSLLFTMLYIDLNPNSTIPFASPQSKINLFKLGLKFFLPFYTVFDYKGNLTVQFIAIIAVFYLILLFFRYTTPPYYNKSVFFTIAICETTLFWISCVGVIHAFLDFGDRDNIGLFYLVVGIPFMAIAFVKLLDLKNWNVMKMIVKNFKKDDDVENYILILIDLIENKDKSEQRIKLEGILKFHLRNCGKTPEQCNCSILAADNLKEEETAAKQKRWYEFLKSIMTDCLEKFQKSPKLHILNSYLQHEKLRNKFKALFELMITEENKPNIQEEFSIYRYKNLIEEEMIENDSQNNETKGVDVNVIVHFQNKFVVFQNAIEKSVNLHLEFWRELLEENPDIQKLQNLGSKITNTVESTSDLFKKLNEMNPNHIRCLEIYGNFLKEIVNDDSEGQRILEKADYIGKSSIANKQFIDNERLKYGENSNTCIITCSGNFNSIGTVTNSNNEITRILGYSKNDIIGQNISRIMPKVYADLHDGFMRSYLETSESKIIGMERLVLPQNKNGYLVPCTLMIKVLPNLDEGIQIVGFLKDIDSTSIYMKNTYDSDEKVHYMVYSGETGVIQGITNSCYGSFGIVASLVYGNSSNTNEFTIDAIANELMNPDNFEELKSPSGLIVSFDTSQIQQNFLLGQGESDRESEANYDEEGTEYLEKQNKYRKTKVRAHLIDEQEFGEVHVNILKFVEVSETDDLEKEHSIGKDEKENNQIVVNTQAKENNNELKESNIVKDKEGKEEKNDDKDNNQGEDMEKSEKSSNISASVNEDLRQLKDFKALISEKTVPKSIKILKRTVWLLGIILIILTAVELSQKLDQSNSISQGTMAIYNSVKRGGMISDINYEIRRLYLLAFNQFDSNAVSPTTIENDVRTNLGNLVNGLQNLQFEIIKARIVMDSQNSGSSLSNEYYNIEFLLQTGAIQVYQNIFNDAVFQFITSASSLANSTLASFNVSTIQATQKNFFYVQRNGLGILRRGTDHIANIMYQFYNSLLDDFKSKFEIIMILGIVFLILAIVILIPIVFSVHRTNNRVLSLFGTIPLHEIRELASKCEKYIVNFLEDKNDKKADSEDGEEENKDGENDKKDVFESKNKEGKEYFEVNNEDGAEVNPENVKPNITEQSDIQNDQSKISQQSKLDPKQIPLIKSAPQGGKVSSLAPVNSKIVKSNIDPKNSKIDTSVAKSPIIKSNIEDKKKLLSPTDKKEVNSALSSPGKEIKSQDISKSPDVKKDTNNKDHKDAKDGKGKEEEKKEENNEDFENQRTTKLMNSKDNNRKIVVIQFSFIAALFITYFVVDFVLQLQLITNVRQSYNHLRLVCQRPNIVKNTLLFTIEQIANASIQTQNSLVFTEGPQIDVREYFTNLIYDNERDIFQSMTESYPGSFSGYQTSFEAFNYDDLCATYYASNEAAKLADCNSVANGLLQKGLRTSIVSLAENTRDIISQFFTVNMINTLIKKAINSELMRTSINVVKFMVPAIDYLNLLFVDNLNSYMSSEENIEKIKFSIFIIMIFFVFLFIWTPYLRNLNTKIWRTKGMLNMIPMDIISKNENLKNAFISGDILQAVK